MLATKDKAAMTHSDHVWALYHLDIDADLDETEAEDPDDSIEYSMKRLGYYTSEAKAREAAVRAAAHPRFQAFPGGCRVYGGHALDKLRWGEGFFTYYYSIKAKPE